MKKHVVIISVIFFLVGISFRAPLIEKAQSHWDGPQYSIAIRQFDLSQETPAPPGYPIYIFLGWIVDKVVLDPHASLLLISVIFSGFSAVLFLYVGRVIWNWTVGTVAAVLFISSPAFYYFGLTPYAYGLLPFFTLLLGLVVYKIVFQKRELGILLGVVLGIYFGFRPQELPMFIAIGFFGLLYLSRKEKVLSILFFCITTVAWFVSTSIVVGGVEKYVLSSVSFFQSGAVSSFSLQKLSFHSWRMGKGLFLSFTIGSPVLLWYPYQLVTSKLRIQNRKLVLFFFIWMVPSIFFNFLIRSDHAGYQIPYLSVLLLLLSFALWKVLNSNRIFLWSFLICIVLFNFYWFFHDRDPQYQKPYTPTSFHYSEIVKNDLYMTEKITYILNNFDPEETAIIVESQSFRPVMYYLKNYHVYNLNAIETEDMQYSSVVREGINWKQNVTDSQINHITFSDKTENIIFFDNEFSDWIAINSSKRIDLSFNQTMTYVATKKNSVYAFDYHSFYEL